MGQLYADFQRQDCEVLILLGGSIENARRYADILRLPFAVLADPEREVYHRYGLDKAVLVIQRTAAVIVDRQGVIRFLKRAVNPLVWLQESRELLREVETLTAGQDKDTRA